MTEPLWRRLRRLHGPDPRADVRDEFAFHLDERTEALMTRGWPEAAAREEALRQFGDLAGAQATCTAIGNQRLRRARVRQRLETFTQDVRYAVRFLRRAPGFTTVAILSLGLGIGANTAVFSLVDAVLIRSLPVRDPGSLVQLMAIRGQGIESPAVSYPDYLAIRDRATVLADVAAMTPVGALSMRRGNSLLETLPRGGLLATGNYFAMLGVRPHLGRLLQPEDTRVIGGAPVVVLGHEFWRQRFGADSSIVGQPLSINDTPYTVVGVAPREFFGTQVGRNPDVYLPVTMAAAAYRDPDMSLGDAGSANFHCLGRLESGVDAAHAAAELSAIFAQVQLAAFGDRAGAEERRQLGRLRLETRPARSGLMYLRYRYSKPLLIAAALVMLVLLIACVNVANLVLARGAARRLEIAVRISLGVSRARLFRQLFTESLLLALAGGAVGVALAAMGTRAIVRMIDAGRNVALIDRSPDGRVLAFTFAASVATALVFGLVPALQATRADLTPALSQRSADRRWVGRVRAGRLLVVAQVALSALMLVGTGLFARTLSKLNGVETGFRRDGLLLVTMSPERSGYRRSRMADVYQQILQRFAAIPGVTGVALSTNTPFSQAENSTAIRVEGYAPPAGGDASTMWVAVTPGFFRLLGTELVAGRDLSDADNRPGAPRVVVVNQTFVKEFLRGRDPLGKRLSRQTDPTRPLDMEIVGVVRDTKFNSFREGSPPIMYLPFFRDSTRMRASTFLLSIGGAVAAPTAAVRGAVAAVDPALEVMRTRMLREQIDESIARERLMATLSAYFGILGLVLVAVGLYGVMAYGVARRTREIGIRMALGADRRRIAWLVLGEALALVAAGVAIGIPAAIGLGRFARTLLFDLQPSDPATLGGVVLVLLAVALVASVIPGSRAARVDPVTAIRTE